AQNRQTVACPRTPKPPSGPGNPLSDEELATKFHLNATRTLPEARATELATRTLTLPEATSLTPLTTLLPPGDGR
ncbi:MAG TPA: hypothetical protein VGA04_34390, partial [Streptosporangiaceae bacterium]